MPSQPQSQPPLTATRSAPTNEDQAVANRPAAQALFVRFATGVPLKQNP